MSLGKAVIHPNKEEISFQNLLTKWQLIKRWLNESKLDLQMMQRWGERAMWGNRLWTLLQVLMALWLTSQRKNLTFFRVKILPDCFMNRMIRGDQINSQTKGKSFCGECSFCVQFPNPFILGCGNMDSIEAIHKINPILKLLILKIPPIA